MKTNNKLLVPSCKSRKEYLAPLVYGLRVALFAISAPVFYFVVAVAVLVVLFFSKNAKTFLRTIFLKTYQP